MKRLMSFRFYANFMTLKIMLVLCGINFSTAVMGQTIILKCLDENGEAEYLKLNKEEIKIHTAFEPSFKDPIRGRVLVWKSDLIMYAVGWAYIPPKYDYFNGFISALDRVNGRLQTVYVNNQFFGQTRVPVLNKECDLFNPGNPSKPKF